MRFSFLLFIISAIAAGISSAATLSKNLVNRYIPIENGWKICVSADQQKDSIVHEEIIGIVKDDARNHRRPLYPPADRTLLYNEQEIASRQRIAFRPMVLAHIAPRFVFDLHNDGGLMGHLLIGLKLEDGTSKWFHQWSNIEVQYRQGQMEYTIRDEQFPNVCVRMVANPLADAVGGIIQIRIEGISQQGSLVWMYGGSSGLTNGVTEAPEYSFAPSQCIADNIELDESTFVLSHKNRCSVTGGSSWTAEIGWGDPAKVLESPTALLNTMQPASKSSQNRENSVAVQAVSLQSSGIEGFIVIGAGKNIKKCIAEPATALAAAVQRNIGIMNHVVTATPDPYFDNAVTMMAFPLEGIWGESAILHGAWAWRIGFLGWRGWYGPMAYGWPERVKHSILQHVNFGVVKEGADKGSLSCRLDTPGNFYNMNEVFLDHVRQYFDYTNDLDTMRQIFPVLKGIIEWENRRLLPNDEWLYENSLNIFMSDAQWYMRGQCTEASAYMFAANSFMSDLAKRLGQDDEPFTSQATKIREAMQRKLWLSQDGVFASYIDTLGNRLLHPEPELATIYHPIEFGIADPLQAYQMLYWTDTHLRPEITPNGGRAYWSSNWAPTNGRSYTHTSSDLTFQEQLNLAIANCIGGRADDAYSILKGVLCGIYNGPTPGGLSAHMYTDGRQRHNDEFADSISLWGRLVCEGIFGIIPKCQDKIIKLSPCFPSDWTHASIKTKQFTYKWQTQKDSALIEWTSPSLTSVHLKYPVKALKIKYVKIDGRKAEFKTEPGVGCTWIYVNTPLLKTGIIKVSYEPFDVPLLTKITVKQNSILKSKMPLCVDGWIDPQNILSETKIEDNQLEGRVNGRPGAGLLFVTIGKPNQMLLPQPIEIEPIQSAESKIWQAPKTTDHNLSDWHLIDMAHVYNAPLTGVTDRIGREAVAPPEPACQEGFLYWKAYMMQTYHGTGAEKASDAAWRKKVGPDNVAWATDGIPFKTAKDGNNIAAVTLVGGFPAKLQVTINAQGKRLYLMISGMTFPVQSHVVNLRLKLNYQDGSCVSRDLINPFDIGDCWGTWCGRFHDTPSNGFENIGGRRGPAGSSQITDMTKPVDVGDTEAHLIAFDLKPVMLSSVEIEAVANDVVFGIMGATILKD